MAFSRSRSSETIGLSGPDCAMIHRLALASNEERVVQQRGRDGADERAHPVDELPLENTARDRRTERPSWIHRRSGEWPDGEDVRGDREPNREPSDSGRLGIDGGP